jgi:hypothetical protein
MAERRGNPISRLRAGLRAIYDGVIEDPVRAGHIRIDDLDLAERQAALVGILAVGTLLISIVFNELWRRGALVYLASLSGHAYFVPAALLPFTVFALFLAWSALLWGAVNSSPRVLLAATVTFVLIDAPLGRPLLSRLSTDTSVEVGPLLARVGYFAVPAVLVLYALTHLRPTLAKRVRPFVLGALLLALAANFGGQLWSHATQLRNGISPSLPLLMHNTLSNAQDLLVPAVTIAGLALITFAYDVGEASAIATWTAVATMVRWALAALLAVKLWFQLISQVGEWRSYISSSPLGVLTALVALGLFAAVAVWARRLEVSKEAGEAAKERLIYGTALLLAAPILAVLLVKSIADFVITQTSATGIAKWFSSLPITHWIPYENAALWAMALVVGIFLLKREPRKIFHREAGVGLLMIATWCLIFFSFQLLNYELPLRETALDIGLTTGVLLYTILRWRAIDATRALGLIALLVFSWLVASKGDYVVIVGGLLPVSQGFLFVFGMISTLATDSGFTAGDTKYFPRSGRTLLWVGYLLLSLTIVNWLSATHSSGITDQTIQKGLFFLGLPLAAWLVIRQPFGREVMEEIGKAS